MKALRFVFAAGLAALIVLAGAPGAAGAGSRLTDLMPVPEKAVPAEGKFRVTEALTVGGDAPGGDRAFKAAIRFMERLAGRTGLFLRQDFLAERLPGDKASVAFKCARPGRLEPFEDESYTLTVTPEKISLVAPTDLGIVRGFETLGQLLDADGLGSFIGACEIQDRPRFTWRGLLIDSCRHFMPVDVIKRNLDGLAAVKMNVLHWHLTEDQGFRVESRVFPRLHKLGSDGRFYTQEEIRDIIAYAGDRGIRVVPEFDVPGHSTSWFVAYPEYASAPGPYRIERSFGIFGPAFNPADERIYGFFDKFLGEMARLFPDAYLHIGGDEVNPDHWKANPAIQAFMKKNGLPDNHALQAWFNKRLLRILQKHGKRMMGWDEIFQPGLPTDIVIQSWRGQEALVEAARKGYAGLLSNGYYIDLCQTAEFHYLNDPLPADSPLTPEQKKLVLGGEATMWAELVSAETVDSRIWPRTAAIAERLWSPGSVRDVEDMYRRLADLSPRLEDVGLTHLKNPGALFRRLAGGGDIHPLQILAGAAEPLKIYKRHGQAAYTSMSPLTRFVDALAPESLKARAFRAAVDRFVASRDPKTGEAVRAAFLEWRGNHPRFLALAATSPILREVEPLSLALSDLSGTGLEALAILASGETPDPKWTEAKTALLAEAAKPMAHAELVIVSAVEKLVKAAAGKP
jgi:hexosaminidase